MGGIAWCCWDEILLYAFAIVQVGSVLQFSLLAVGLHLCEGQSLPLLHEMAIVLFHFENAQLHICKNTGKETNMHTNMHTHARTHARTNTTIMLSCIHILLVHEHFMEFNTHTHERARKGAYIYAEALTFAHAHTNTSSSFASTICYLQMHQNSVELHTYQRARTQKYAYTKTHAHARTHISTIGEIPKTTCAHR